MWGGAENGSLAYNSSEAAFHNNAAVFEAVLSGCGPRAFFVGRLRVSVLVRAVERVLATRHPFAVSVSSEAMRAYTEYLAEASVCVNRRTRNSHTGAYGSEDLSPSP